ncbi:MAG: PEP-CTERM sorting domain-containing protein [Okeania sp. SIO2C2]|nr:PEP-CTERM sorting domain-containing protein [Okeania sp. SIO2C2]
MRSSARFSSPSSIPYAKFTPQETPKPTKTPEPTLIFGLITLGGLMLGSKRKTKG